MIIGHMVYFTLKNSTPDNIAQLLLACQKYLSNHPGTIYFGVGTLAEGFDREVNDQSWDVALHLVFCDKEAHDAYQVHPRHEQFIAENKETWQSVRVFDSHIW